MFINNITGNANFTEGIGSIFSFKLMSYALSQIYNLGFVSNRLTNVVGGNFVGLDNKEYDEEINKFFELDFKNVKDSKKNPFDIIFDYTNKPEISYLNKLLSKAKKDFIINSFSKNINKIMSKNILTDLSKSIPFESNQKYFKDGMNVVIHLRAPLREIDIKFEPDRSYFYGSYKDIDLLNNFIRQLEHSESNQKINFHFLTIGENESFAKIKTLYKENNVYFHNNLNIFETFSMMVHNDVFVGGYSNLSYIAHLLTDKKSIFPKKCSFGYKALYPNIIRLDENGMVERLNSSRLIKQIVSQ